MENKPLIGVVQGYSVDKAVEQAGAETVWIDSMEDAKLTLEYLDGIVLTGGSDVDPARYGEKRHAKTYGVDAGRDAMEFYIVAQARKLGIPIMGICRGSQVLNVAHGGTLIQELDDAGKRNHWGVDMWVKLAANSRVGRSVGNIVLRSSHFHHQAVKRVGKGLRPIAWASDGTIEAIESDRSNRHYVLGVQFHPEMDYTHSHEARLIFQHFARMCGRKARGREATDVRARTVDALLWKPAPMYDYTGRKYGDLSHGGFNNGNYGRGVSPGTYYAAAASSPDPDDMRHAEILEELLDSSDNAGCSMGQCAAPNNCAMFGSCYAADVTNLMGGSRPLTVDEYIRRENATMDAAVDDALALDNLPLMGEEAVERAIQQGKRRNSKRGAHK